MTLDIARGRVLLAARAVRLRQDHDPAHDRRLRAPDGGRILLRDRDITTDPPDKRAGEHGVPELRAVPPPRRSATTSRSGPSARACRRTRSRRRVGEAPRRSCGSRATSGASPTSCPAASSSGSRSPGPSSNRPNVLLLDEPLGALDLKLRRQLQVELKRIQLEVGITFVYVTHDQEEALTMSDRIAVMDAGRVEQLGTPEELYERPRTRFVADFIGTSNLLPGPSSRRGRRASSGSPTGELRRRATRRGWPPATPVDLSVRPEASSRAHRRRRAPRRHHAASVEQAAYLGTSRHYSSAPPAASACHRPRRRRRGTASRSAATSRSPGTPDGCARPRRRPGSPRRIRMSEPTTVRRIDLERDSSATWPSGGSAGGSFLERDGDGRRRGRPGADHRGLHRRPPRPRRRRAQRRPRPPARRPPPRPPPPPSPRPSRRPRASCSSTTGPTTSARTTIKKFEDKYGIKVTYDFFDTVDTMLRQDLDGQQRLRRHVPDLDQHPGPRRRRA